MTAQTIAAKLEMTVGTPDTQEIHEQLTEADQAILASLGQMHKATYEYGIDGLVHKHHKD